MNEQSLDNKKRIRRMAIVLCLVALSFYGAFILMTAINR